MAPLSEQNLFDSNFSGAAFTPSMSTLQTGSGFVV
jgi:hypothetical protein